MRSIQEVLNLAKDYLEKKGIDSPRRSAEELIADLLGIKRMDLYLDHERPLTDKELDDLRSRLKRRSLGEPAAYIRGFVDFLSCRLNVDSRVLIPRPETEIMADLAIKKIIKFKELSDVSNLKVLDLCTGSGCLGLSVKAAISAASVTLSDLSAEALQVAALNAKQNALDVKLIQADLFEGVKEEKFHLILCNPPYIGSGEYDALSKEVIDFEPKMALIAGVSGMEIYESIFKQLKSHLMPKGQAWFEIGFSQGEAISRLAKEHGFENIELKRDWAGHDRFFFLENE